jgi:hypothetical protein
VLQERFPDEILGQEYDGAEDADDVGRFRHGLTGIEDSKVGTNLLRFRSIS